jgi:hypothetical protein
MDQRPEHDTRADGITVADIPKLRLKWAFGLGDGIAAHKRRFVVVPRQSGHEHKNYL